jgi:pyridoxamine 5'-phosphate oxidase
VPAAPVGAVAVSTPSDPFALFHDLFERAASSEEGDPTAMALATADAEGRPSVRIVLLKGVDARGFVFYTNLASRKARDLAANPAAALCLHWPSLEAQVRAEGTVEPVTAEEADVYFASRPRGSQVAAWASRQSEELSSRERLIERFEALDRRFAGEPVPRPPFWSGYRLVPERIEFWRGVENRLHHRTLYVRDAEGWTARHLYP